MPSHAQERYLIRREAGRGKRAIVQEAYDTLLNRPVALKVGLDDVGKRFLLEEAQRLARVRSPYVVTLYDYLTGDQPRLVLEWLAGQTLRDRLSESTPLPFETIHQWTHQLLQALAAAHEVEVLHGDIKPENIWIDIHQQLRLFDFGMTPRPGGDATALYAPAEVLQGQAPTAHSDLYCVGSVVFEMLTGHPPFDGSNAEELAQRKATRKAPQVQRSGGSAHEQLEAWLARVLEGDPSERFDTAKSALEEWQRVASSARSDTRSSLPSGTLHAQTVSKLLELFPVQGTFAGTVITLAGGSGHGKTELLQHVLRMQQDHNPTILVRGSHSVATDYRSWIEAVHSMPSISEGPQHGEEIARRVEQHLATRQATREILVVVDDFAECDTPTRELLLRLARQAGSLRLGILAVTNEGRLGSARSQWCALQDAASECLRIQAATVDELHSVFASRLDGAEVHDELYAYVHHLTAGNPRFALQLFEELRRGGHLTLVGQNWQFQVPAEELLPSRSIAYLEQALSDLTPSQRELLVEASLHGMQFSPNQLAKRLRCSPADIAQRLHDISMHLDLLVPIEDEFRFTLSLLQLHLENSLASSRRLRAHDEISEILLGNAEIDEEALGPHLFRAGRLLEARTYLSNAGAVALQRHELEPARRNLHMALQTFASEPASETEAEALADLLLLQAQVLLQLASWDAAVDQLNRCLLLAQGWGLPKQEVQAIRTRGRIYYKRGQFEKAITTLREAQECATNYEDAVEVHELAMQIGNLDFERGNLDDALSGYMSALLFAAERNDPELEARASNNVALIHSTHGDKPEAIRMFSRSLQLFKKLRRQDAVARTQHNIGMTYLELHNWAEARNYFQESIEASSKIGLDEILAVSRLEHAETNLRLGRVEEARPEIEKALALCQQRNDPLGTATAYRLQGMVAAHCGDLALAEAHLDRSIRQLRDLGETPHLGVALKELARVRLEAGETTAAMQTLREAREILTSLGTPHEGLSEVNALWDLCQKKSKQNA